VLLAVLSLVYFLLFVVVETGNWLAIDDLAPIAVGLLLLAGVASYYFSVRTTRLLYSPQGELGYRGSPVLVVVWLVLLLLEIFVQQVILGHITVLDIVVIRGLPSPTPVDPTSISHPYRVVLATVDALFALSTGVALGNNAGLYSRFARRWWRRRSKGRG
jgi:hypothetical protein